MIQSTLHGESKTLYDDTLPATSFLHGGDLLWLTEDGTLPQSQWRGARTYITYPHIKNLGGADPYAIAEGMPDSLGGIDGFIDPTSEAISASISDFLQPPSDSLTHSFVEQLSAAIADLLTPVQDRIFPPPIEATHYTGSISDYLAAIVDRALATLTPNFGVSISDTLGAITDDIAAGMIRIDGSAGQPGQASRWLAPLSVTPRVDAIDPLYLASHAVRHPSRYYEPRIESYGTFDRSIACPAGFVRTGDVTISILDPDNEIRQRLAPKTIRKAKAEARLGPERTSLAAFLRPWIREVSTVTQPADGKISMTLRDFLFDWMDWQVPGLIDKDNFPNLPDTPSSTFANLVIGEVAAETGALPCPLVDTVNFRYLVNRHPSKSVDAVYRKRSDEDEFTLVNPSEYTVTMNYWLDHPLGLGDYCTLLEFASDQKDAEIRANVQGIIDDAGDLRCTNFADCILEIFQFLVGVTDSLDRINFASFDEVRTKTADLLCAGAWTKPITFGEAFTQLQRSSNIDIFCDKNDRITVAYTADSDEPVVHLDDLMKLYKGTVRQSLANPTYNRIPYRFAPNFADDTWAESDAWDNPEDQTALDDIVEEEELNLYFVRDAATAAIVADYRGSWLDLNAFRFEGEIPLIPVLEELELAQLVSIEHFGGIKSGGYVAEQFKILELSMDVDNLKYQFKGIRRRTPPPAKIESTADGEPAINSRVGPWPSGTDGELFAVFRNPSDRTALRILRTIDYGENWTADDTMVPLSNLIFSFDSYTRDDGLIHVAVQEDITGRVSYHAYSMAARAWTIQNEEIVAAVSNRTAHCVSIETRYPGGEPVIFFQGENELVDYRYWVRGYFSIRQSGAWSVPVMATPNPGDYKENHIIGLGWDLPSADCAIQRIIAGRENRMHFFWSIFPSVCWVQWSPDEYCISMQSDFSFSAPKIINMTSIFYPCYRHHNIGGAIAYQNRELLIMPRRAPWASVAYDVFVEGPALFQSLLVGLPPGGTMEYSIDSTDNPAIFAGHQRLTDDTTRVLIAASVGEWGHVTVSESLNSGIEFGSPIQAGPDRIWWQRIRTLVGNFIEVRGRMYVAYFCEYPSWSSYYWLAVDDLPYTS